MNEINFKLLLNQFVLDCTNPKVNCAFLHAESLTNRVKMVHPEVHDNLLIGGMMGYSFLLFPTEMKNFVELNEKNLPEFSLYLLEQLLQHLPTSDDFTSKSLLKIPKITCIYTLLLLKYYILEPYEGGVIPNITKIKVMKKSSNPLMKKGIIIAIDKQIQSLMKKN